MVCCLCCICKDDKCRQLISDMGRRNIAYLLREREYRRKPNIRLNLRVMREIVCEKETSFKRIWQKKSNSAIAYEDGRLYFDNYRNCYTLHGTSDMPKQLYCLPRCPPSQKVEDGLICSCSLSKLPLSHEGWKNHFLALTAHNWLHRQDLDTGRILQQIYLSSRYKFRHITWDIEQYTLVIKSTHIRCRPPLANQNALLALAVFEVFPLKFVCMFEIRRSVFGTSTTDAMISQGALIMLHSGGMVRIYSMEHVLKSGLQFKASLHQYCRKIDGVVGTEPTGIPTNLVLDEAPPVLFEVRCAEHHLTLGGVPWHYIISAYGAKENFKVYSLENYELAENGSLEMKTLSIEADKCMFHMDNSGRILHIGPNEVRVLRLKECDLSGKYKLNLEYRLEASKLNSESSKESQDANGKVRYSASGREVKLKYTLDDTGLQETIADLDYENEMDLLTVTSTHSDGERVRAFVHLINNDTGEVIKDIPIVEQWKEYFEHVITVDLYNLIHIIKGPARKFECNVYRLERDTLDDDGKNKVSKRTRKQRLVKNSTIS